MTRGTSGAVLWLVVGGLVLIAIVPKEVWVALGILPVIAIATVILVTVFWRKKPSSRQIMRGNTQARLRQEPALAKLTGCAPQDRPSTNSERQAQAEPTSIPPAKPSVAAIPQPDRADEFYSTPKSSSPDSSSYSLPKAPADLRDGSWVPPGTPVQVAGIDLPEGMIYVGRRLNSLNGLSDPCLINDHLPIARAGDYRARQIGYWPNYAEVSPNERRAYLNWLSEGRSNPDCDIGYVFLFFYGLERRVILDSRDDPAAKGDWPVIIEELRRLLTIYGEKSGSFRHYAGELLSWIELDGVSNRLYEEPVPNFPKSYGLPPYLRLALGQASGNSAPLPASLALAWLRLSPDTYLRTAATRCPDEFEQLFRLRYQEVLGSGLVLPKNQTKLKFVYQGASAGLRGATISMDFGDIPDVTALTSPIKTLKEIADQCTDELGSYSRLLGKDPSLAGSLESLLLLPATLWPMEAKTRLDALIGRMRDGFLTIALQELFTSFGGTKQPPNRDRVRGLARALENVQIGLEPNVLSGAKVPGGSDKVVLFAQPLVDTNSCTSVEYQTAALTLQLASAMAEADGDFSEREIEHLRTAIDSWLQLTLAERRRLHAHLQWLITEPPTLAGLKRRLEPLPGPVRETIAAFMVALAQSDGFVSPEEIKFLGKIYKALGVEPARVFRDVHAAGTSGGIHIGTERAEQQGFHLDADRIAALEKDTARVSTLLSKIFAEEDPSPTLAPPLELETIDQPTSPLGLDEPHSTLVRLLLSRPHWTRAELEDAASDLDLMLDGALELINEAALDAFAAPLCEGDNSVEVNTGLLEKIDS